MKESEIMPSMVFERWTVLTVFDNMADGYIRCTCKCECGEHRFVLAKNLVNGGSKSCGCLQREAASVLGSYINKKHGLRDSQEYAIWGAMKTRCYNKKADNYERYGGKGIKVCQKWLDSFEVFYDDMGPRPSSDHSIDRLDSTGDYEPGNCVWSTRIEQANNKSNNRLIKGPDGIARTVANTARAIGISHSALRTRLHNGMSEEEAVSKPLVETKLYKHDGLEMSLVDWEAKLNIPSTVLRARIEYNGWSVEKAFSTPLLHQNKK